MIVFVASRKYCVARRGFFSSPGSGSITSTSVRSTCIFSNRFAGLQEAPRPTIAASLCGLSLMTARNFFLPPVDMGQVHMNIPRCREMFWGESAPPQMQVRLAGLAQLSGDGTILATELFLEGWQSG